jgi:hypothetical protein
MSHFNGGFYFIATLLEMKIDLPYQIDSSLKLERANLKQIEIIKKSLIRDSILIKSSVSHMYESTAKIVKKTGNSTSWSPIPLKKRDWRYYVLTHSGNNYSAHNFFMIANLVPPYIQSIVNCGTSQKFGRGKVVSYGKNDLAHSAFYDLMPHLKEKFPQFNISAIEKVKSLLHKYYELDIEKHEGIRRAIELNSRLQQLRKTDNLYILGLFMIIEMLLTHNPKEKEVGDSINHQIKTKIAFLETRLNTPLNYLIFDNNTTTEKIWSSLYHYRSCIAHGNHVDFKTKELKILKDGETALNFLDAATKSLLSQAIIEPDIFNGLKPI